MDSVSVRALFSLFSGEDDIQKYEPIISLAENETLAMLLPDADRDDVRLDFLCASLANARFRQMEAGQDRSRYTYAGKFIDSGKGSCLEYAERMFRDYLGLCSDLVKPSGFVFFSFPGKEDISDTGST